jgi:hypothetical protein
VRRKTYIKKKEDCISLNHTKIRVEKWVQVRHVLTHTESTLKKDLNLKKLSGATFLPYGYVRTYRAKFGHKAEKKERTHPVGLTTKARQENNTTCQQRRGRKVTSRRR